MAITKLWKGKIRDYCFIVAGVFLLAISISVFFEPSSLATGGVTGLGILIQTITQNLFGYGVPVSVTNIVVNVPLFILAYFYLGKGFLGRTVFATILLSVALTFTDLLPIFEGDLMLTSVYGGVVMGAGIGLVLRGFATTGGTELLASILHKFFVHIPVSKLLFLTDGTIIALGLFVFGAERAMYAVIAIFISTKVLNTILEGMAFSKAAFIISDYAEIIADEIMRQADRGVTALHGKGMYTRKEKNVLLCVFSRKEVAMIKDIVRQFDPKAFVIVTDVKEVLGEGFGSSY